MNIGLNFLFFEQKCLRSWTRIQKKHQEAQRDDRRFTGCPSLLGHFLFVSFFTFRKVLPSKNLKSVPDTRDEKSVPDKRDTL